jgi:hypothetical protein
MASWQTPIRTRRATALAPRTRGKKRGIARARGVSGVGGAWPPVDESASAQGSGRRRRSASERSARTEATVVVTVVRDVLVLGALVVAFATLVTAHVTLALGLLRRTPRWRAPVALVVPPLAPFWGWLAGMRARSIVWVTAVVVYAVARVVAR